MAKRLNSAPANTWGLSQIKRRMKTLWHVLFHNLAAAETSDSSHVCENSLPVLSVCYCTLRRWFYGLDCRAVFLFVVFALRTIQTARQMQPELISFGNPVANVCATNSRRGWSVMDSVSAFRRWRWFVRLAVPSNGGRACFENIIAYPVRSRVVKAVWFKFLCSMGIRKTTLSGAESVDSKSSTPHTPSGVLFQGHTA